MRKKKLIIPVLALSFLISCGDKQPPTSPTDPGGGGLTSGGITPIEPIGGLDGGLDAGLDTGFDPAGDDFVDAPLPDDGPPIDGEEPLDPPIDGEEPIDPPIDGEIPVDPPIDGEIPVDPPIDGEIPVDPPIDGETPVDPPAATVPADLTSSNITPTSFKVSWTAVTDATSYKIYVDDAEYGTSTTSTFTIDGRQPDTSYSVSVSAVTAEGESAKSSNTNVKTGAVGAPTSITSSNITTTSFNISWASVSTATSYKVFLNGTEKATPSTTSYSFTDLSPNTTYSVTLSAITPNGESVQSAAKSVKTSAIGAPSSLSSSNVTATSASISWSSVTNATAYKLYLDGTLKDGNITSPNYNLSGLVGETTYSVSVSAVTPAGESAKSSPLSITTIDPFGNKKLGFLNMTAIESADGLDVQNGHAYVGHFVNPGFFSSNKRYVRDLNIATGAKNDLTISTQGETKVTGVAVTGATIWAAIGQFDKDGFNLYKYNINGQQIKRYKVGTAGTIISDIAVDASTGLLYIGSRTSGSIIKHDDLNPDNSQLLFSGATNIDPLGLATDTSGNVYTFDGISRKLIKFSSSGTRLLEFGPTGVSGAGENYTAVSDVAVDPRNGDIFITGNASGSIKIFRYSSSGNFITSFSDADLLDPRKLSVDANGKVYVIDQNKKGVIVFSAGTNL